MVDLNAWLRTGHTKDASILQQSYAPAVLSRSCYAALCRSLVVADLLLFPAWCRVAQVIDAEMARRRLLEESPIPSTNEEPVLFDTSEIPWWAWVRRFHLPEVRPSSSCGQCTNCLLLLVSYPSLRLSQPYGVSGVGR
jgi:hypothetical protein